MATATKDTVPWRLQAAGSSPNGALTKEQLDQLYADFGIGRESLLKMSKKIAIGLSAKLNLGQPETRSAKFEKGAHFAKLAAKELAAAQKHLERAFQAQQNLAFKHLYPFISMAPIVQGHRDALSAAQSAVTDYRGLLEVSAREGTVWLNDTPDRRKIIDIRRRIICVGIFNCWDEEGRKLTFTTDPLTSERTGPLLTFVNAVVGCITDPSTPLPGEAIKGELDDFKASIRRD